VDARLNLFENAVALRAGKYITSAGHAITGAWGITFTTSGQTVTARGVSYNSNLGPGQVGSWGFQASRPNGNTSVPSGATCTSP